MEIVYRIIGLAVDVRRCMRFHLFNPGANETELLLNLLSHGPIERGFDVLVCGAMYYITIFN